MGYYIEPVAGAYHVRGAGIKGSDFLQKVCKTEDEAKEHIAALLAEDAEAAAAAARQADKLRGIVRGATPRPYSGQYAVLAYFDNGDPDIYGPFASLSEARAALARLRPYYGGDHHVTELTVHKLRAVR